MWTKGGIACWEAGGRASQADAADKVDCMPGAYGKGPLAGGWGLQKGTVMQIEAETYDVELRNRRQRCRTRDNNSLLHDNHARTHSKLAEKAFSKRLNVP